MIKNKTDIKLNYTLERTFQVCSFTDCRCMADFFFIVSFCEEGFFCTFLFPLLLFCSFIGIYRHNQQNCRRSFSYVYLVNAFLLVVQIAILWFCDFIKDSYDVVVNKEDVNGSGRICCVRYFLGN